VTVQESLPGPDGCRVGCAAKGAGARLGSAAEGARIEGCMHKHRHPPFLATRTFSGSSHIAAYSFWMSSMGGASGPAQPRVRVGSDHSALRNAGRQQDAGMRVRLLRIGGARGGHSESQGSALLPGVSAVPFHCVPRQAAVCTRDLLPTAEPEPLSTHVVPRSPRSAFPGSQHAGQAQADQGGHPGDERRGQNQPHEPVCQQKILQGVQGHHRRRFSHERAASGRQAGDAADMGHRRPGEARPRPSAHGFDAGFDAGSPNPAPATLVGRCRSGSSRWASHFTVEPTAACSCTTSTPAKPLMTWRTGGTSS